MNRDGSQNIRYRIKPDVCLSINGIDINEIVKNDEWMNKDEIVKNGERMNKDEIVKNNEYMNKDEIVGATTNQAVFQAKKLSSNPIAESHIIPVSK